MHYFLRGAGSAALIGNAPRSLLSLSISVAIAFVLGVAGCNSKQSEIRTFQLNGQTMGTTFGITLVGPPPSLELSDLESAIYAELEAVELSMSTYIETSEISRFNRFGGSDWYEVSSALCSVVDTAINISRASGGAFDVTVGAIVNIWGFGPGIRSNTKPDQEQITSLLSFTGPDRIESDCMIPALRKTHGSVTIDLSAIAKGYAVDQVADLISNHGISNYLVEIGGEIRISGHNKDENAWSIAVESPILGARSVNSVIELTDTAVASSGDYRNFFRHEGKMYSHTIDPRTGYPIEHEAAAVTVIAECAMVADAWATALLVLGPDSGLRLAEQENIAVLFLIRSDAGVAEKHSPAFSYVLK